MKEGKVHKSFIGDMHVHIWDLLRRYGKLFRSIKHASIQYSLVNDKDLIQKSQILTREDKCKI